MLDPGSVSGGSDLPFGEHHGIGAGAHRHDRHAPVHVWQVCLGSGSDGVLTLLCLDAAVEVVFRASQTRVQLQPGQLALVAKAQVHDLGFSGNGSLCLVQCPRSAIQARGGRLPAIALGPMETGRGLGALVRQLIVELCRSEGSGEIAVMQETLFQLMASLLGTHAAPRPVRDTIPARIIALIEGRLADPELSPEMIAACCGLSLRSLQRRFARAGESVGHWIRHRRLERCYADLMNPRWRKHSIASIAFRWGFVEQAHFSRCFRQQYGISPREVRLLRGDFSGR